MNRLARLCPDAVAFEYRSIDRLILNAYIPTLQTPGAMAYFLREVRRKPILSGIVFKELTDDFVKRTRDFAQEHGLSIQSAHGVRPGELGQQMLAKARKQNRFGVIGIIAHQERARVFCSTHGGGRATNFRVKEDRRMVNHYYFYIRDRQYGEGFVRICTYELRKLRGKGLVHKAKGRNRYTLTPLGQRVVPALVKFQQRLLGPTLESFDQAVHRICEQGTLDLGPPDDPSSTHELDRLLNQLNCDMDALAAQCCFRDAA